MGQFETSEGTFCAQVGTAGFFALPMSKRRKALHGVMEQLEKEVADGHVNEGAHVRLCKRLKKAFNASGDKRKHIKEYLLEALTDDPIASMSVPVGYRDIMEDPDFLQELVKKKGEDTADGKVPDEWWRDLLSGLLPDWMLDQIADTDFLVGSRGIVGVLLAADIDALPHLEAHLDACDVEASALFSLTDPEGGLAECYPDTQDMLTADARLVRWLLKKPNIYSEEDKKKLQEWAFDYSTPSIHQDAGWREAMGLRHMTDVISCVVSRALGKSYEEALAMSLAKYTDEPGTTSERAPQEPHA